MVVRDAAGSVQLIRRHRELRFLLGLGILTNAVVYPFYAILPAFLVESGLPSRGQAVLYGQAATAYGVGMLVGTLLLLAYRMRAGSRRALAMASIAFAAICSTLMAVTVVPWPEFVVAAMALNGALFAVLIAVGGAVWLRRTPAAIRVRVFSLRRLTVFSSIPLGTMLMGFGGAAFGYHLFVRGMVLAVLIGLAWLWLRHGRRLPRDDAATPAQPPDVRAHKAHSNQQEAS
jgi:MFS family permease